MSDRTIAPGANRMAAAWRSGLRPGARWLIPGAMCVALGAALDLAGGIAVQGWGTWLRDGIGRADLGRSLVIWSSFLLGALLVVFAGALALRTVGPVGRRDPDVPAGLRTPVFATTGLALAVLVVLSTLLSPVSAGAARAVDASELGLAAVWARWAMHLLAATGVLLLVAGVAEHLVMRQGLWRDLHMTRAQAREQSRPPGGR